MEELILKWGSIAGACSAVFALLWKMLKPIHDNRKKEKEELAAYRTDVKSAIDRLETKLDEHQEDIAYLQRYELKTAHVRLMEQGWCSPEKKSAVLDLYDHYKEQRGRNSLVESYRKDIESLPHCPPIGSSHYEDY